MRSLRSLALVAAVALAVSACAQVAPVWTFTPASPSPSAAPSSAASAAPSGAAPSGAASAAPSGAPASAAPSGAASAAPSGGGTGTTIQLLASGVAFDQASLTAPANAAFKLAFTNNDAGIQHNVAITSDSGQVVFAGEYVTGTGSATYDVPAIPAGSYKFVCQLHPNMTGTLTVQ